NVTPAGSELETTTSCAVAAPPFPATSVQANDVPGTGAPGDAAVATVTSGVATRAPATDVVNASPTSRAPTAVAARPIRRDLACRTSLPSAPCLALTNTRPRGAASRYPPRRCPPRCEPVARPRIFAATHVRRRTTLMQRPRHRIDGVPRTPAGEPAPTYAGALGDIMSIIGVDSMAPSKPPDRARAALRAPTGSPSRAPRPRSTARSSIRRARVLGT